MAQDHYIVAIDFGSSSIKIAIAKSVFDEQDAEKLQVLSLVEVESMGIKRGVITNMNEASESLIKAIQQSENIIGLPIRRAVFGINGRGITFTHAQGITVNSRPTGEINDSDIERLIEDGRKKAFGLNDNEILHIIPKSYKVDNQPDIRNPIGMIGTRIEANILFISIENSYLRNFIKVVDQAQVELSAQIFTPLATSDYILTHSQKKSGTLLIDIGSTSTAYVIWEDEELYTTGIIPIGSDHITQDLAVGLQTTLEMAEEVKRQHINFSDSNESAEIDSIEVYNSDLGINESFDLREAQIYAKSRAEEIFSYINKDLRKVGKHGKLAGGAVIVGGGANLKGIIDVAKNVMKIPVFKYKFDPNKIEFVPDYNGDPTFINSIALLAYYLKDEPGLANAGPKTGPLSTFGRSLGFGNEHGKSSLPKWLSNILPWK